MAAPALSYALAVSELIASRNVVPGKAVWTARRGAKQRRPLIELYSANHAITIRGRGGECDIRWAAGERCAARRRRDVHLGRRLSTVILTGTEEVTAPALSYALAVSE